MTLLWPPNGEGHYILQLWFLSICLSFFLAYSQRSEIGCLPYFHAWCDLSANNLERRSKMCCKRLAKHTGRKNYTKNRHLRTIAGYIFATKACIDNQKNVLNSNISSTCPHNMVNFGRLSAEMDWRVWGTLTNFNGFRLASLLHQRRSTEVNQTLHGVWPSPGLVHYLYIFGGACP